MKALILTGGLGTRLRPLTLYCPKPLLPIANVPFLSYPLALLRKHGVHGAVLCMADSAKPYQSLIRDEQKNGTHVECSRETKELGTAGALKNAERFIQSPLFFVFNGDVLTDIDLTAMIRFHNEKKADVTVALIPVPDPSAYGLAVMDKDHRILKFVEKPPLDTLPKKKNHPINAGIYLYKREILDLIPKNENYSVEKQLYPDCLKRGLSIFGFPVKNSSYWLDIGSPQKFKKANQDMVAHQVKVFQKIIPWKRAGEKNIVHKTAVISEDAVIGKKCRIGAHAVIDGSVLLDGVTIEDHSTLRNCVIGSDVKIEHHSIIENVKIVGNGSIITPFSKI